MAVGSPGKVEPGELVGEDELGERLLVRDQVAEGDAVVEGAEGEVEPSDAAAPPPPARRSARCDGRAPRTPCRRGSRRSRRGSAGGCRRPSGLREAARSRRTPARASRRRPACRGTPRRSGAALLAEPERHPQAAVGRLERERPRFGRSRIEETRQEASAHTNSSRRVVFMAASSRSGGFLELTPAFMPSGERVWRNTARAHRDDWPGPGSRQPRSRATMRRDRASGNPQIVTETGILT